MQVLVYLAEHAGEVVTKEELIRAVWPDAFVTDDVLKRCVSQLRKAFDDDPREPRAIETIAKGGYRLLLIITPREAASTQAKTGLQRRSTSRKVKLFAAATVGIMLLLLAARLLRVPPMPRVTGFRQITNTPGQKTRAVTDGTRVFYSESHGDKFQIMQVPLVGGDAVPIQGLSAHHAILMDVSNDGSELLYKDLATGDPRGWTTWTVSSLGGVPRRLGEVIAMDAVYSPDGRQIAYSSVGEGVYVADRDGTSSRLVASAKVSYALCWSPDGKRLRYSESGRIWEVPARGTSEARPALPEWQHAHSGGWTRDGRFFVFKGQNELDGVWAIREGRTWSLRNPEPAALSVMPVETDVPKLSPDGKKVLVISRVKQGELIRYDPTSRRIDPVLPGTLVDAAQGDVSSDGQWVTYIRPSDNTLWRARIDGTEKLQLTFESGAHFPKWSPDSARIAFSLRTKQAVGEIHIVERDGRNAKKLSDAGEGGWDMAPVWSPDGTQIIFSHWQPGSKWGLRMIAWPSGTSIELPADDELLNGSWSPDGRFIAALHGNHPNDRILLFDVRSRRWSPLVQAEISDEMWLTWSPDSRFIYFRPRAEPILKRVDILKHSVETFGKLPGGTPFYLLGGGPGNSLLLGRDLTSSQIYAFDLEVP
jgi:Tol biopolymer transport system component